ncbi:TPM domain-containing protein [Oceanobacillus chungangensis]|uniref:TPM domain-containing protein n=1 Tax=Oceanobacillus chungangensis TaxID=1229152 RepID=A0A3D8PKX8_9BACI|nr:TPM domain-containing protein [Oceanobacillus chungangensis]RDW15909.1 hypothetical protein CWR45_15540 [Oceanobacillus chungangensis]
MQRKLSFSLTFLFIALLSVLPLLPSETSAALDSKQRIYDYANLLTEGEKSQLEKLASDYGAENKTDFVILTTSDTEGKDIKLYMEDFYEEQALGYDKPHGNTAIITLDMKSGDVYLAGFYKADEYLSDSRLDQIRNMITPDLSNGDYYDAFTIFIQTSSKYMGISPWINPELFIFKLWFQILAPIALAAIIVGLMAFNSGGRVTVNERTYLNTAQVTRRKDRYLRTTVTKTRKPSNNNGSGRGGGGGGGRTSGGHSHSGSRGSF